MTLLLKSRLLRGCNVHHGSTVIRQDVDLGALAGVSTGQAGPEFAQRYLDRFAELRRRLPDSAMPEGFLERLRAPEGVPFEEALLEAIVAVESAIAYAMRDLQAIGFAAILPASAAGRARLVWECRIPRISRSAAVVALTGCLELLPEALRPAPSEPRAAGEAGPPDFTTAFAALEALARRRERSTTTAVLELAAKRRGLPCEALGGPYLRLGQGAAQRLLYSSVTERTSLTATQVARNKHRTNRRLAEVHLPVTRQFAVASVDEALAAADALGYPVVVKPMKQKQASGVSVRIIDREEIPSAFARAQRGEHRVIVEGFVPGDAYRLLVIGGAFIAALRTVPPTVTGDGERNVGQLIEALNQDPLRDGVHLFKVEIDEDLERDLRVSGYALDRVLEKDKALAVRLAANVAVGGLHSDVTELVHPDNQEMAIRAAARIGLDVAGVDFVTEDIGRSWKEGGGRIIEVNARPGLCMHTCPLHGKSRRAADAFLELLYPPEATGRIPVAIAAGGRRAARVARDLDAMLASGGRRVGLATRGSALIAGEPADIRKSQLQRAASHLLRDPRAQSLVSAVSLRRTMKEGLGLEACDVAAILNRKGGRDAQAFRAGIDVLVKATRGMIAVSAENATALEALSGLDPKRLILIGSNARDPVVARHVAGEGAVVLHTRERDQNWIVLYRDGKVIVSIRVAVGEGERVSARRLETRMFAVALAFGMGLQAEEIEAAVAKARPVVRPAKKTKRRRRAA